LDSVRQTKTSTRRLRRVLNPAPTLRLRRTPRPPAGMAAHALPAPPREGPAVSRGQGPTCYTALPAQPQHRDLPARGIWRNACHRALGATRNRPGPSTRPGPESPVSGAVHFAVLRVLVMVDPLPLM